MLSHLLLYRMTLVNTAGCALALWAYAEGYVAPVFAQDTSRMSFAILALFAVGIASAYVRGWKVSAAKDAHKTGMSRVWLERRAAKMASKNEHVGDIANWLFTLGMLGTVVGFYVSLDNFVGGDPAAVMEGMRIAIGTTLVGGFLGLWVDILRRMLDTATAGFLEDVK
jgi:hypothetical protein